MHSCLYEYDEQKHINNEKNISFEEGIEHAQKNIILRMLKRHKDIEEIAADLDVTVEYVKKIEAEMLTRA